MAVAYGDIDFIASRVATGDTFEDGSAAWQGWYTQFVPAPSRCAVFFLASRRRCFSRALRQFQRQRRDPRAEWQ